jgi:hypothetical protein
MITMIVAWAICAGMNMLLAGTARGQKGVAQALRISLIFLPFIVAIGIIYEYGRPTS